MRQAAAAVNYPTAFSEERMREYGAACRAARAKGEDVRDAERYRWLMRQVPSNIADIFHECAISEVGECIDDEIEAEKRRAAATAPEGKGKES